MDMYLTHVCLWTTLLSVVVTWAISHVSNRRKKTTKLTDTTAGQERRYGGPDVIIVGAGVGGSALAYALAKDGRRVHVIERDMSEPVRMMGEFMQPGGRLMLAKLGLQDCLEEIDAQKSTCLSLYKDGKKAVVPFPVEDNNFPYEPTGRTFHNGRFVQRLRQKASSLPNVRLEQGTVKSLIEEKGVIKGVTYKNSSGEETTAFAPLTVVCDGCFSNLRRSLNNNDAEVMSYQVGYISKNCQLEEPEYLHLVMAKPSFTMMCQLSSTEVRCGLELFPGQIPSIANGDMTNFLRNTMAPQVPPKLRKIFLKGIDEGAQIKVMPTKRMAATLSDKKGAIVLGDAFNMRHPSIASGMMVLLSDILILRCLLQPLEYLGDTNKVSEVIKSFYVIRKPMSATVNTLGTAFSQVLIASTDKAKEAMRQGCYDYLSSGGFGASGLMALLGGMNPRPLSLIYHLFVVTLSATVQLLSPFPSPLGIWHSLRLFGLSMKMLVPHLKAEGVSQMLFPPYAAVYRKTYMTATTI
ncbi:PREDICTED: squalene monooxygenase 1,1-like [Brassica oleracea var. oleracea]|uniref:Squalene monooxygenase n=1 Tax=Brassica oleracea var. oleracea TaxID=109376 RepID=A0A0D3BYQ9_BRAOL|nr:PREDICTED: squalene monooxygenase 1,1-like [Brassica oleracea var. oleracea]